MAWDWDLWGTRGHSPDLNVIDARESCLFATVAQAHAQIHGATSRLWPLTLGMVAYTMPGLWILAQPLVEVSLPIE
ncbi:MAG: hypothetical protein EXR34_10230 [Rhodoferax sp.]|nr:hypothetical protein [Rhodoferax sp.]